MTCSKVPETCCSGGAPGLLRKIAGELRRLLALLRETKLEAVTEVRNREGNSMGEVSGAGDY